MTPTEKKELALKEKAAADLLQQQNNEYIKGIVNRIAATEDGKEFLRWLALEVCGYNLPKVIRRVDTLEIEPISTTLNAVYEDVWMQVRKHMESKYLKEVEYHD